MQRLAANLYAVFLDGLKRDEPPHEADWLYEDDICHRELPAGAGRDLCESLKEDRLHVAQFLTRSRCPSPKTKIHRRLAVFTTG